MAFLTQPITRRRRDPDPRDPFSRVAGWIMTTLLGVMLGLEYWSPNKRIIPVMVALVVFGLAWRLSMVAALNMLIFLLPYPKGTVFGNTNLAFILIMFVLWLLRLSLRTAAPARGSPIDLPIFGMVLWYILSFYNIRDSYALTVGLQNFEQVLACIVLYYLIINNVRTQRDLQRFHGAQLVTALVIFLIALWEAHNVGKVLIPGVLDFSMTRGNDFNRTDVRVGSSLRDYELLSEYCGIALLLVGFYFIRATSTTWRVLMGLFGIFALYTLFTTVTRGIIVALALVLPYSFYLVRRHLNPVRMISTLVLIGLLAGSMNYLVKQFTNSGDLFERVAATKLVHGIVPESRESIWANALGRALTHPIIGQGPYYGVIVGYNNVWPHNVYLYIANLIGFPGLLFFLLIIWRMLRVLHPRVDDLRHPSYADAYLIVAQSQLLVFAVNELKIDYLRNPIYPYLVWTQFGGWVAAYLVSRDHGVRAGYFVESSTTPPARRIAA
jgi:hypothetical protein